MAKYLNGQIPAGVLTTIASGRDSNGYWEFQTTQATYVRWQNAKKYAEAHFGRTMYIRTGWNIYRPLIIQKEARIRACAQGNCLGAAAPGYSSHGGNWQGRDCLAIDVEPNGLSWAQVWEACRSAGFACGLITSAISGIAGGEPWHIIDFDAFGAVPAGGGAIPFPNPEPVPPIIEENLMELVIKAPNGTVVHFAPGVKHDFANPDEYGKISGDLEFIRAKGGTDAMKLPPLNEVVGVSWEAYIRFCAYFNVPTDQAFPAPGGATSAEIAEAVEAQLHDEFAAVPGATADEFTKRLTD